MKLLISGLVVAVMLHVAYSEPYEKENKRSIQELVNIILQQANLQAQQANLQADYGYDMEEQVDLQESAIVMGKKKSKYVDGTAIVELRGNYPKVCSTCSRVSRKVRVHPRKCKHQVCTDAKNEAKAQLRDVIPPACYPYITSNRPCPRVFHSGQKRTIRYDILFPVYIRNFFREDSAFKNNS